MLKNAKNYEDRLNEMIRDTWYDLKYQYVNSWCGSSDLNIPENNYDTHMFVSVNPNTDEILGVVGYEASWTARSAYGFFAMSFIEDGRLDFAKDLYKLVDDIFLKYNFLRMDWTCYADNPAIKGYRNFCKRYGGREVGYFKRKAILLDGYYHDSVMFELLWEDYVLNKKKMLGGVEK